MQDILPFIQQHPYLVAILCVLFILLSVVEFIRIKKGATRVSPQQATRLINHEKGIFIDVRSKDAFDSGHIIGAISIPLADLNTKNQKLEKFKLQPIVLVCATGIDSLRAATSLKNLGFSQVHVLSGGVRAWRDADLPFVRI